MKWITERRIKVLKKLGLVFIWLVLSFGLVFAVSFTNTQEKELAVKKVIIQIYPENLEFFNRKKVVKTITENGNLSDISNAKVQDLNTSNLEKKLTENAFLQEAKVYNDLTGNVFIKIRQREPILRLYRGNGVNFYIDKFGVKFQTTDKFTAHVPLANGNIFERSKPGDTVYSFVAKELYKIASYVDKQIFWKAQIEQIFVTRDNEFILIPKIGNHQILFGNGNNLETKFEKLFVFYKEGLSRVGWNKYKIIDIRFDKQVVCK
jgi:cell division protein FtsQ